MSPEQASGSAVDKRSDIWSFGVVLFELLAGRRLFEGETTSHTMADVLRADIDWTRLPASTPGPIRKLLERCLERDRKRRLQAIGEARIIIEDYLANASPSGSRSVAIPAACVGHLRRRSATCRGLIAAAGHRRAARRARAAVASARRRRRCSRLRADLKISDAPLFTDVGSSIELSPDATRLVVCHGHHAGRSSCTCGRSISSMRTGSPRAIRSTSPYQPFFSPDGQWLGYVTSSEMRKVPVSGGTPLTLTKVTRSRGASWSPDGTIIFAPNPARRPASASRQPAATRNP